MTACCELSTVAKGAQTGNNYWMKVRENGEKGRRRSCKKTEEQNCTVGRSQSGYFITGQYPNAVDTASPNADKIRDTSCMTCVTQPERPTENRGRLQYAREL